MKLFKPITKDIISRWLRTVMCSAGVDCDILRLTVKEVL